MPLAIWCAIARSIFCPDFTEDIRLLYASSLKYFLATFDVKTFSPNMAVILFEPSTEVSPFEWIWLMASKRTDIIDKFFTKEWSWLNQANFFPVLGTIWAIFVEKIKENGGESTV